MYHSYFHNLPGNILFQIPQKIYIILKKFPEYNVKGVKNMLPDWANTVLTNEFEDDPYWEYGIEAECPEAYYAISNIQQSPSDINQFVHSRTVYNEYIGDIIDYYGGMENIRAYMEEYGQYPPGYCDPPRLSISKKKNRAILRSGVIPQKIGVFNPEYSGEELASAAEAIFNNNEDINPKIVKPKGRLKKLMKKELYKGREKITYRNREFLAASYDVIAQAYSRMTDEDEITDDKILTMSYDQLADLYDNEKREEADPWKPVEDDFDKPRYSYEYNRVITPEKNTKLRLMKDLNEQGFNSIKLLGRKATKAEKRFYKDRLGLATMTKKELKREKKNRKSLEGYLTNKNKREDSMRALSHMLTRNSKGISSDIDEEILNDIIRRNK